MWPDYVHCGEVQARLFQAGVPVERAMRIASEVATLKHGDRYRIELESSAIVLYAQGNGWSRVAGE